MDIGQHGGLPSTPPRIVKRARFFRFFPEPFPYFPNISQHFQSVLIIVIFSFHSRSRSRPFPGIIASDSRSRISGTFFFIPFPFPNFGNAFFHSLPVPEFWEWIFSFPSRSRILGMEFSIPFPFPNFGNGIFYSRSRSRTLKSHSRSPLEGVRRVWRVPISADVDSRLPPTTSHFIPPMTSHMVAMTFQLLPKTFH